MGKGCVTDSRPSKQSCQVVTPSQSVEMLDELGWDNLET